MGSTSCRWTRTHTCASSASSTVWRPPSPWSNTQPSCTMTNWSGELFCALIFIYTPSCTLCSTSDTPSLQIPRTRLSTVGSCVFSVFSPSTWNDLPLPLQQKPSLDSFKSCLRTFLFPKTRAMFSILCCCLHPSQVCLLPVLKLCVN